jgi:hypothetical protein
MKITLLCLSFLASLFAGTGDAGLIRSAHAGPGESFRPCDRIAAADVQPFFKTPVKKKAPESNGEGTSWNCVFEVASRDGWALQITVMADMASAMFSGKPPTDDGKPGVGLTGIGDQAIRESNDVWVYARKGPMFCMVHGDHSYATGEGIELMRGLTVSQSQAGKFPPATAQTLAQALGTLCNRAFGSGNTTPSFANLP